MREMGAEMKYVERRDVVEAENGRRGGWECVCVGEGDGGGGMFCDAVARTYCALMG